jgi:phage FluMu protein Com
MADDKTFRMIIQCPKCKGLNHFGLQKPKLSKIDNNNQVRRWNYVNEDETFISRSGQMAETIAYVSKHYDQVLPQHVAEEVFADSTQEYLRVTSPVSCGHCSFVMRVVYLLAPIMILPDLENGEQEAKSPRFSTYEDELIKMAKKHGLFEVFLYALEQAVRKKKNLEIPKSKEKYFLTYFLHLKQFKLNERWQDSLFREYFGNGFSMWWSHQYEILTICVDGIVVGFVHLSDLSKLKKEKGKVVISKTLQKDNNERIVAPWTKTRNGYVLNFFLDYILN